MDLGTFDDIFDAVLFVDKSFRVVYANKSAKRILGDYLKIGNTCRGIFSTCSSCPFYLVEEEGEGVQIYDVTLSTGKHVCWSMSPVFKGEEFVGVLEVFRDVSNVIFYMEEVKKQKEFTEVVLNSIVEAIVVISPEGYIMRYNNIARKMLCMEEREISGLSVKDVIGLSIDDLKPEGNRFDVYVNTPCGKQKASVLLSPLGSGGGYVLSVHILPEITTCSIGQDDTLITKNPVFKKVLDRAKTVAEYPVNVLIEGETGTGKSLLAKYIHYSSSRRNGPFVKVNCAAIPENLLEVELFGYVKGAFTGAVKDKPGKVEIADEGTLFLDEIGDMPIYLQAKILNLVQSGEFERLGDTRVRRANIRIVAATNKNLKESIKKGEFREDLYYRLNVVNLKLPPLRERKEDIPLLVKHFLEKYARVYNKKVKGFLPEAIKRLLNYGFPGNVRELENIVERALIICEGPYVREEDIVEYLDEGVSYKDDSNDREKILEVLKQTGFNKTLAAKLLGIHRTTLWRKLREIGL